MQDYKLIFEEIMRSHYSKLLAYVRTLVSNGAAAQDITQETFISAYKSFGDYREQGKIFPWLKAIARNTAYRHMQRENRHVCLSFQEAEKREIFLAGNPYASAADNFIADEGYKRILQIINKLPSHQRRVFYCRFVEGMSVGETAGRLNLPLGTVKSKAHYGMAKIRGELKSYLIEGDYIMDCKKTYEYLYQYAKNAILAEDRAKVEKHLEVCTGCRDIAQSLQKLLPQIKPAPEGIRRHYSISFQVEDGMILGYYGVSNHIPNYKALNETLAKTGGEIPKDEIWFRSGFGIGVQHLAEFDNEGNHIEVEISLQDANHHNIDYKRMKKVFEYHETNSASYSSDSYKQYTKSKDAPNLYIVKNSNQLGQSARSGLYAAIPGKAVNVRLKQGVDVLDCGAYQFVYDDRYITDSQMVCVECTYNM